MADNNNTVMTFPKDVSECKSFLGACSYYRRFIPNFAVMAEPIRKIEKYYRTKTTKVGDLREGNEAAHRELNGLKAALANAPVLVTPHFTRPFIILPDTSKQFIGAVLAQRDANGIERPIAYNVS